MMQKLGVSTPAELGRMAEQGESGETSAAATVRRPIALSADKLPLRSMRKSIPSMTRFDASRRRNACRYNASLYLGVSSSKVKRTSKNV